MDERIDQLSDRLRTQVHPDLAEMVDAMATEGASFDEIMDRLRSAMAVAETLRNGGAA